MGPLLGTKLHVPRRSDTRVPRPRLDAELRRGGPASVTVVSAPAGFGKTTAVTGWLESLPADGPRVAWVSLDERDDDPPTFWAYVIAALDRALGPGFGEGSSALLESSAPLDAVVATLVNELVAAGRDVVLVLDDYHVLGDEAIHRSVTLLLDRLPDRARVVVAGRADPPLPLGRLRVAGRLVEVRATDLRFTPDETASYLARATDAALSDRDVAALADRTEGWAAALQLAALSMHGRDDASSFIAGFTGDDRFVVDYLAEEVLDRQDPEVRRFLLRTSILDRMCGPLCDAVTARSGGRAMLERLERANLFLVPLDDSRRWYRYHHLFGDVLRVHLGDEDPVAMTEAHARAGAWFAANGEMVDAIGHTLAAGDVTGAADLVESAIPGWQRDRQEVAIRTWVQRLPAEVVARRPVLIIGLVGALASIGEFADDTERRLDEAERLLALVGAGSSDDVGPVVVADRTQLAQLPAAIEMYRAARALMRGDLDGTRAHGRRALDRAPGDDHLVRAAAAALVGLAAWAGGDIRAAFDGYSVSIDGLLRAGHRSDVLGCSITLADLQLAQGRLRDARRTFEDGLALGAGDGGPALRGTADMHVGLSEILRECGDLDGALEHLHRSAALGEHNGLPQHPYRSRLALARLRIAAGDLDAASALLDEAEQVYTTDFSPSVRPIPAVRAGWWAEHGRLDDAVAWARDRGLGAGDGFGYLVEFEYLTLARVLLAQHRADRSGGSADAAVGLLERLVAAAEAGGRTGDQIAALVVLARAEDARGSGPAALAHLERALSLAEPEGYVRLFLDEGPRLRALLEAVAARGHSTRYVRRLLDRSPATSPAWPEPRNPAAEPRLQPRIDPLIDPLSGREFDVLRLLAGELTGPEIARELTVSLNTFRTHTRNIYAKLGVTSRRSAVRRAEELHLLGRRAPD